MIPTERLPKETLDDTDLQIVQRLRRENATNIELARELGVSEGTIRQRLKRLKESGRGHQPRCPGESTGCPGGGERLPGFHAGAEGPGNCRSPPRSGGIHRLGTLRSDG